MSELTVSIRLDEPTAAYLPGGDVSGRVTIRCPETWVCRQATVMLAWRTEGVGDEDSQAVVEQQLFAKDDSMAGHVERPFRLKIPDMPWTYHGRLIKIHWLVCAYARAEGGREYGATNLIIVHPRPAEFVGV